MVIKTEIFTPDKLFSGAKHYEVPPYQRRYVWNRGDQWELLWNDISGLVERYLKETKHGKEKIDTENSPTHFLSTIVLQTEGRSPGDMPIWRVIDGQQRIITLQILFDAAYREYDKISAEESEDLQKFVSNDRRDSRAVSTKDEYQFKVWPTRRDQEVFSEVMKGNGERLGGGEILIRDAHKYFSRQIGEWLGADQAKSEERCKALFEVLAYLLQLVVITIDKDTNPQVIFETLNARGTPLSQSDLIKNWFSHFAQQKGMNEEKFHEENLAYFEEDDGWWDTVVPQGRLRRSRIDQFFNYWLAMRLVRDVKSEDVFSEFQKHVEKRVTTDSIIAVASDIRKIATIYQDIEKQNTDKVLASFVERKNILQAGVLMPPLLWLIDSGATGSAMSKSLRALESFFIRRAVCGTNSMGLNRLMFEMLARMNDHKDGNVENVIISFLQRKDSDQRAWPSDAEFRDAFLSRRQSVAGTGRQRLVMILKALDEGLTTPYAEDAGYPPLSIEHVMPREWRTHWAVDPARSSAEAVAHRDDVIHTMGNLTLVTKRLNSSVSNGPWSEKRAGLQEHSTLFLNKDLLDHVPEGSPWDEAAIRARGERLYEVALEVWPGPDAI